MDPYSSLEEKDTDSDKQEDRQHERHKHDNNTNNISSHSYYKMCERKVSQESLKRSQHTSIHTVTYAESDSHSSDSDYQPTIKSKRNKNVSLQEPSKSRLMA